MIGTLVEISVIEEHLTAPESPLSEEEKKELKLRLGIDLNIAPDDNVIKIIVDFKIYNKDILCSGMKVSSVFHVLNLGPKIFTNYKKGAIQSILEPAQLKINQKVANSLSDKAISHARALHARMVSGTTLDKLFIPLVEDEQLNSKKSKITMGSQPAS